MEADLRIARGMALAERRPEEASNDLEAAAAISDEARCPMRSGRARLAWADRIESGVTIERRLAVLDRAIEQLSVSKPWATRARYAKAKLLAGRDRAEAMRLALGAAARFCAMEMAADEAVARTLVQLLR